MNTIEYVIRPEGTFKRSIEEFPLQVDEAITDALAANVTRGCKRVTNLGGNYGGVAFTAAKNDFSTWSVRVLKLPINTHFNLEAGVLVPVFDNPNLPVMNMMWTPPDDMCLILGVGVTFDNIYNQYKCFEQHLSAFDSSGRLYKLPLSNVYNTTKLCHGLTNLKAHKSCMEVVQEAAQQFNSSQWNRDLYLENGESVREKTKNLFRFIPKGDGMEQGESKGHWATLSEKVGNDKLQAALVRVML